MKLIKFLLSLLLSFAFVACSVSVRTSSENTKEKKTPEAKVELTKSDVVELTLLQLNDVYEIAPVENGKFGGMARVATVRQQLLKENPNTFTFLSGDFISPSAIGTSKYQGKRINGAQMVDAMNAVGVDYVCLGNHEFDLGYEPLQDCINQSKFTWISSNIMYTPSTEGVVKPFEKNTTPPPDPRYPYPFSPSAPVPFPEFVIVKAKNASGAEVKVGVVGVTIGSNRPSYVVWSDPIESAKRVYAQLKNQTDFVIGITHLSIEEDKKLASELPELKMILGGHEHTNMMFKEGNTIISKADANARTVYIHRLRWNAATKSLGVTSEVKTIDATIHEDSATAKVVNDWTTRAYAGFQEKGFNAEEVVATLKEPLDGRESTIRYRQTNLGDLIAKAMLVAAKKSRVAIFNSGSIRLDDQLMGTITQYDIIRTLPFGGVLFEAEMKGSLLQKVLDAGMKNLGRGGFLQYAGVYFDSAAKRWSVAGKPVEPNAKYSVIVSDYLFSGNEHGIEFFKKENPDVLSVTDPKAYDAGDVRGDIRLAVIGYLKRNN